MSAPLPHAPRSCPEGGPTLRALPSTFLSTQVNQSPNMWAVMRGNCQDGEIPTVTIEFDFEWPEVHRPSSVKKKR